MKIDVDHLEFKTQKLAVEIPGVLRRPRLLVNGSVQKNKEGIYSVLSDSGVETLIVLKRNFFDPVPRMKIGNETVQLARRFTVAEYLWFGILIVLIAVPQQAPSGSALVGVLAAAMSAWVFRSKKTLPAKFGLVVLITVGAFVVLVALIVSIHLLTGAPPQ